MTELKTLPADFSPTTAVRFPPKNQNLNRIPSEGIVVPHSKGPWVYFPWPKSALAWDAVIANERTYWHEQMEGAVSSNLLPELKFKILVHLAGLMEKRLGRYHELKGAGLTNDKLMKLVRETKEFARKAAAKTIKDLKAKSRGGKAGCKRGGIGSTSEDETLRRAKATMMQEVRNMLAKRSRGEISLSKNCIYQIVAGKHKGDDGNPIFQPCTVKSWFMPSRRKRQRKATS